MKNSTFAGIFTLKLTLFTPFFLSATPHIDPGVYPSGVHAENYRTAVLLAKLDAEEARQLKQTGKIMSLEQLIVRVQNDYPGQIIEIELDEEKDHFVYDIEIIGEDGVVIELKLDAATGEVLKYEKDR